MRHTYAKEAKQTDTSVYSSLLNESPYSYLQNSLLYEDALPTDTSRKFDGQAQNYSIIAPTTRQSPTRCLLYVFLFMTHPNEMKWVAEMGASHALRIVNKLEQLNVPLHHFSGSVVSLVYTPCNIADVLPVECYKHLTRVFYVPHACLDLDWLCYSNSCVALHQNDTILRIQAYPKHLEEKIIDLLFDSPSICCSIHPTAYTHVLSCVYDISCGQYHFGIVSKQEYIQSKMNSSELWAAVAVDKCSNKQIPVCRAYYKMQELFEHYFPLWEWPTTSISGPIFRTAVDVGAAPGGWSQYLSGISQRVLSIDPGQLAESVMSIPNIHHLPHMLQHPTTQSALQTAHDIDLCVCDINVDGVQTAHLLVTSIIQPYMLSATTDTKIVILTLKLPKNPSERIISGVSNQVIAILEQSHCYDFKVVHLNANTRNERTLVCRLRCSK